MPRLQKWALLSALRESSSSERVGLVGRLCGRGLARSLRLDLQLLRQAPPYVLLVTNMLRRARGRSGSLRGEAERQQLLLDVRPVKVIADIAIEPRHHVNGSARWCHQRKPAVHDDARHRLADGR